MIARVLVLLYGTAVSAAVTIVFSNTVRSECSDRPKPYDTTQCPATLVVGKPLVLPVYKKSMQTQPVERHLLLVLAKPIGGAVFGRAPPM